MATLAGVSRRSVQRVDTEATITEIDTAREREVRGIGRPAKAEPFRSVIAEILALDPELLSVEILRRTKLKGYIGGKTALYTLITALRPKTIRPLVRFEGLGGEFTQHDSATSTSAFSTAPSPPLRCDPLEQTAQLLRPTYVRLDRECAPAERLDLLHDGFRGLGR